MEVISILDKKYGFSRIDNTSVVQNVIDQLTEAIISGKLKPGDQIPTETELARSFGVGRNSIREAIKIFIAFGVLEIRRAEGTFVSNSLSQSMINPLLYGIILNKGDSYESIKEFRKHMEIGILKLSIKNHTDEDLKMLREAYENLIKCAQAKNPDVEAIFEADNKFHSVVSIIAHNALMETMNELVRKLTFSKRYETTAYLLENNIDYLINAHTAIYDAIVKRDASNLDSIVPDHYFID